MFKDLYHSWINKNHKPTFILFKLLSNKVTVLINITISHQVLELMHTDNNKNEFILSKQVNKMAENNIVSWKVCVHVILCTSTTDYT